MTTSYLLLRTPSGEIATRPLAVEDPEPIPTADGTYHLLPGDRATALAWELFERGVPACCGRCGAPLKISRAYVLCSNDDHHFNVIV